MTTDVLQSKLDHLPGQPGCYLFRNAKREILYVGKAAVLADRVRSYFQRGSDHLAHHGAAQHHALVQAHDHRLAGAHIVPLPQAPRTGKQAVQK